MGEVQETITVTGESPAVGMQNYHGAQVGPWTKEVLDAIPADGDHRRRRWSGITTTRDWGRQHVDADGTQ